MRFDYVKYDVQSTEKQLSAKSICQEMEGFINEQLGAGRTTSLALTKLEELYMWVGKAIRDDQLARDVTTENLR